MKEVELVSVRTLMSLPIFRLEEAEMCWIRKSVHSVRPEVRPMPRVMQEGSGHLGISVTETSGGKGSWIRVAKLSEILWIWFR